ncbi:MAG: TonB-dependent receptor [Acidobacteria bacterium]|nr:TonB-dependent receptor [Acidobacteriota bacterium]
MRGILLLAVPLLFVFSVHAYAQTANATLGGTVSDATGALIPGVIVTATNAETGIVNTTLTNEAGVYQFASLQPGTYRVTAELTGFQTQIAKALKLNFSEQARFNFTMQVGTVATSVDVNVAADTLLASSSSVGTVLPEYKVNDLPLANRDVLALTSTMAGVVQGNQTASFAGGRTGAVQTLVNGVSVNDGRYQTGVYSATQLSPDLVEEVRILVSPADAETGRGSGAVQVSTRSGTNQFRGSLFYTNHNSALDSNTWFNNFNGVKTGYSNRNQFGGRIGGPVIKNKTFFFFVYDGQRSLQRANVNTPVYSAEARQGIFRYFPGVQNGNALAANPTVDLQGNPVRPATATGPLASFNVFTRDPNRPDFDPAGYMKALIAKMPMPNNWTTGDGLNTANYQFTQRQSGSESPFSGAVEVNRDQLNFRVDHNFNSKNKFFLTVSREHVWADSQLPAWPGGVAGTTVRYPAAYTSSFVSTISPAILNEFRFGLRNGSQKGYAAYDRTDIGQSVVDSLPKANGIPYIPRPLTFANNILTYTVGSRVQNTPLYQYVDTISWTRGKHAFKGGVEVRFGSTKSQQGSQAMPLANFGAGGVAVQGMTTVAGLAAADQTSAQNLLINLAGSVSTVNQSFFLNSSSAAAFQQWSEMPKPSESPGGFPPGKIRNNHQREMSSFFKDDWKITRSVTLNLGVRWEYYGVPWEEHGLFGSPSNNGGNGAGVFGISGSSFTDLFQPGRTVGSPTVIELVGKNSPNPQKQIYQDDYNNFGPAIGLSWSVPWFGKDKTTLRAGYGISYTGGGNGIRYDYSVNGAPGVNDDEAFRSSTYLNLANLRLPARGVPFRPIGFTDRTKGIEAFDNDFVTPYVQNWNLEIQRSLSPNLSLAVRYIGSKGTKLEGEVATNEVNIFENGILDAFNITRSGGNAPLFDKMLMGLNVTGAGVVNGTTLTGSQAFRISTATRTFIANGDAGSFAAYLNNTTNFTNAAGGIVRNAGLPENFITGNPQFNTSAPGGTTLPGNATFITNIADSTYHSMQLELNKRLSNGFTTQTSYTWSKSIGLFNEDGGIVFRTLRNRSLDRGPLGLDRTHQIVSNGTFSLPFGPNRALLANAPAIVERLVENWQLAGILNWRSGAPLTFGGARASFNSSNEGPMVVGPLPKSAGKVTITSTPGVVTYFDGFRQVTDPARASVTTSNSTSSSNSELAIMDASGNLLLVNPAPGQLSNLSKGYLRGPSFIGLDMNLSKRIRISETKNVEFRMDAINILNHPNWGAPNASINSTSFGRISSATGSRSFTGNLRLNF